LEMKKMHAVEGRQDEASLAGLFMGVNALFCKPAESILPVVAANMLDTLDLTSEGNEDVQRVLFKLLIIPPLVFSFLEWISWSRFTLTPADTRQMREDLQKLELKKKIACPKMLWRKICKLLCVCEDPPAAIYSRNSKQRIKMRTALEVGTMFASNSSGQVCLGSPRGVQFH